MIRFALLIVGIVLADAHQGLAQPAASPSQSTVFPGDDWLRTTPQSMGMREESLQQARRYALTGEGAGIDGAGMIVRQGRIVISWGDLQRKFDLKSTSKSIGVTALGLALDDGRVSLDDFAVQHHSLLGVPPEITVSTTRGHATSGCMWFHPTARRRTKRVIAWSWRAFQSGASQRKRHTSFSFRSTRTKRRTGRQIWPIAGRSLNTPAAVIEEVSATTLYEPAR